LTQIKDRPWSDSLQYAWQLRQLSDSSVMKASRPYQARSLDEADTPRGEVSMKKRYWIVSVAMALGVAGGAALAADLSNLSGQSCGDFTGTWHFVNNQTGGAAPGTLTAVFTGGSCTTGPSKTLGSTQHFICGASGTLLSATTNLPGRLVLSDFTCEKKCDPKTDPKCE